MRIFTYQMARANRKVYIDLDHVLAIDVDRQVKKMPTPHPVLKTMMEVHSWEIDLTMAFKEGPIFLMGSKMVPVGEDPGVLQVDELLAAWSGKS